ncbi:MAG: hypothetical protein IJK49_08415 [Prevotella sp.]|nr:hypothetical protein [Prevotella sp.]
MKLFGKNETPEPLTPQPVEDVEARAAIQALEQRIAQLEAQIAQLESKIDEANANANANSPLLADADSTLSTLHSTRPRQYYLSAPTPEGIFTEFYEEERVGSSVYLLTTDDGINGTFRMLNTPDALATLAISISQFVKPVCKIIGAVTIQPRHVAVHMPGSAVFEDGVWRTTVKAQVQFE